MSEIDTEVSRAITQLLFREPFFGHLLSSLPRVITESISTAAVSAVGSRVDLLLNPTFFLQNLVSLEERVAVIKHEVLHIIMRHLFRTPRVATDHFLSNIAADLVVNQFIGTPWSLPSGAITLDRFEDLHLLADQTLEYYLTKLSELESEPDLAPKSALLLSRLRSASWHSDHTLWKPADAGAHAALDGLLHRTWQRLSHAQRKNAPGYLQRLAVDADAQRRLGMDWKHTLRLFATSSGRTRLVQTYQRWSTRYPLGAGTRIKRFCRLAVVVDTSGSVSTDTLGMLFGEINAIARMRTEVTVVEADDHVRRVYRYGGQPPAEVVGRGGTDFDAVFTWMRSSEAPRFDGCIYLTDGCAPKPIVSPPCRLLWAITPDGDVGNHLVFGRVVQLAHGTL